MHQGQRVGTQNIQKTGVGSPRMCVCDQKHMIAQQLLIAQSELVESVGTQD